jgi:hypothetical protein
MSEYPEPPRSSSVDAVHTGDFNEDLQAELDGTSEVRQPEIDAQYERAYTGVEKPLGKNFEGWEDEGIWPPDEYPSGTDRRAPLERYRAPPL